MEIIINDEITFNKPFIRDIIKKNTKDGRLMMPRFTNKHSLIVYAVIKESVYLDFCKERILKEPMLFYEYNYTKPSKGYIAVFAEIDTTKALDLLMPGAEIPIRKYEKQCLKHNLTFKNEQELISMYMKTSDLHLIRKCKAINSYLGTTYIVEYKVTNADCIKRFDLINKEKYSFLKDSTGL